MIIDSSNVSDLMEKGIYSITNKINNKKYIGSTAKSFKIRFIQHKSKLNTGKHHCRHLQNAYNKYGSDNFIFKIEEIITDYSIIREVEKLYILKYNSVVDGYNENTDPTKSPMLNDKQRSKVSNSLKKWWAAQKELLSQEEYKKLCLHHRGNSDPWNKGLKMSETQTAKMRKPKINGVSEKMKAVHIKNAQLLKDRSPYYIVLNLNGEWVNTFYCLSDLISYSKSEFNTLPVIVRKGESKILNSSKVINAATGNKSYKGLFF